MLKKYFSRENKELSRLFSVVLDQGLMSITTLMTSIVLVRTYDKIDYADLVLLFSIALFILGFQSSIISKPYAISLNDDKGGSENSYFQFNLLLKLLFTIAVCIFFPVLYEISFDSWSLKRFVLFLVYIISHSSYFFVRETLLSERKTRQNLNYGFLCSIGILSLLGVVFFYKLENITIFLSVASLIYLTITITYLTRNFEIQKLILSKSEEYWRINWKIGKWLLGSNILFHLSSNIYPWFLLYLSKKENIAIFAILMSVSGLINPILTALSSYLLPLFVQVNSNNKRVAALTRKWQILFGIMAIFLVLLGFLIGQEIVVTLFGTQYNGLGLLVVYPFIYQAINTVFQPNKIALNAIKRTDINFYILIPRSIITMTLGYFLISSFGLHGVFYTMLIENMFYQLTYYFYYRRIINSDRIK